MEEIIEKLQVFKFNREKENGYRMTNDDYIEFIKTMITEKNKEIDLAVSKEREEKEMLADALLDMYGQYCSDGHMFMSAGEHASGVLEGLGYAKFDDAGAIINTD